MSDPQERTEHFASKRWCRRSGSICYFKGFGRLVLVNLTWIPSTSRVHSNAGFFPHKKVRVPSFERCAPEKEQHIPSSGPICTNHRAVDSFSDRYAFSHRRWGPPRWCEEGRQDPRPEEREERRSSRLHHACAGTADPQLTR